MNTTHTSPLVRQPHEQKITFALSVLQVSVANCGLIGLIGINTVAETFFRDFLNIFYGLHLVNLNDGISNFPAADLGDADSRLCFQVTSDGKKKKVQKTLTTFASPMHTLMQKYDTMRILVIGKRQKEYDGLSIPAGVQFDAKTDVVDVPMLISTLPNTATGVLAALSQLIDDEMPMFRSATVAEQHTDAEVIDAYRSHFARRALWDQWQQEGSVADFRDALDELLGLLTMGYAKGEPVTKPFRRIADRQLKDGMERVHLKLVMLRQLYTHHERLGDINPHTNFGSFNNPTICDAFNAYKQDVIDELNRVLGQATLPPIHGVMRFHSP